MNVGNKKKLINHLYRAFFIPAVKSKAMLPAPKRSWGKETMNTKYVREEIVALERVLAQTCYWCVLVNTVYICIYIKHRQMNIKLPLPVIKTNQKWRDGWKYKKHDDAEIARCKAIWSSLTAQIQSKLQRIEAKESTVEEEFKDGILLENGAFGLKYKESWGWR